MPLSQTEKSLRAKANSLRGRGRRAEGDVVMGEFCESVAQRDLMSAAARLVAARVQQGLPSRVQDPGVLALLAALIAGDEREAQTTAS